MSSDPDRVQDLVERLSALTPPEQSALLDAECGSDLELKSRVEALLLERQGMISTQASDPPAADSVGNTTTQPPNLSSAPSSTADYPDRFQSGVVIADRFTLQERIGQGGMGEVWRAKQTVPVTRTVALKLIKTGMDSKAVLSRFEQERQALALMDHPHIAQVLDGGMTSNGQPFFVMELVEGATLTDFCDQAKLTPRARLGLFISICQAVQHAHQKGIIHRDLKPQNILVSPIDGKPTPKVIDFGVAKATSSAFSDDAVTRFGAVVGTLEYMPPEQASGKGDIDTRADIYSLGVILYELLTGLRPIDARRLKKQEGIAEAVRVIQQVDPPKPSTRLSSADSTPSLAAVRSIDPKRLTAMLRGELDWVVMKCLEKQRDRRYESVNGLVRDIQRYLSDEPVEARPPSAVYRLRKFLQRNRGPVAAAALILLALVGGLAGTAFGLYRAESARQTAVQAQQRESQRAEGERIAKLKARQQTALALEAGAKEIAARQKAQQRLAQIEKSNDILASVFESLDPNVIASSDKPLQATLVDKLHVAIEQLQAESIGDPLVVADMQNKLGVSLIGLGAAEKAIVPLERAQAAYIAELGPDSNEAQFASNNLALAYKGAGKPDLALPLLLSAYERMKDELGADHPESITGLGNLAAIYQDLGQPEQALKYFKEVWERSKTANGEKHPHTLLSMNNLAFGYAEAGDLNQAVALYQQTIELMSSELGVDHPQTLATTANLATIYKETGNADLAVPLLKESVRLQTKKLGADHPDTLLSRTNLAAIHQSAGDLELALSMAKATLEKMRETLGPEHPHTLVGMNNLALAHQANRQLDLALPLFRKTLQLQRKTLGPDHPSTLTCMGNLASVHQDLGQMNLALPLYEEAYERETNVLGADHPNTLRTMNNLATAYWASGQLRDSIPLFEKLVQQTTAMFGADHPNTLMTMANLGVNYKDSGKVDQALPLLERAFRDSEGFAPVRLTAGPQLLDAYSKARQFDKAVALVKKLEPEARRSFPQDGPQLAGLIEQFGQAQLEANAFPAAEKYFRECLEARRKADSESWLTFQAQSLLGAAILGQKKYDDAERELVEGYEGMQKLEATMPASARGRVTQALERLVRLYEANGNAAEAAQRRDEAKRREKP